VNVYCNGERVLSTGYNPATGIDFPKLTTAGDDTTGDMWKVALITAKVTGGVLSCDVKPTASRTPHAALDGNSAYCVDNTDLDGASTTQYFAPGGAAPLDSNALCFH
jgi:Tfp pilus assembly protein PilV